MSSIITHNYSTLCKSLSHLLLLMHRELVAGTAASTTSWGAVRLLAWVVCSLRLLVSERRREQQSKKNMDFPAEGFAATGASTCGALAARLSRRGMRSSTSSLLQERQTINRRRFNCRPFLQWVLLLIKTRCIRRIRWWCLLSSSRTAKTIRHKTLRWPQWQTSNIKGTACSTIRRFSSRTPRQIWTPAYLYNNRPFQHATQAKRCLRHLSITEVNL